MLGGVGGQPGSPWPALAGWYDSLIEAGSGPHETALGCLRGLLPDLDGARVLDLACGQGLATRVLVDAGATSVIGVDSAAPMIELARQRTDPAAPVTYVVDDATRLSAIADGAVDGVTCQLGLMDIVDLDATLAATRRVLRPGGWFVAVISHP
jgi:ubiquinone/menaquinone biosynthesis C-methylase UbiE